MRDDEDWLFCGFLRRPVLFFYLLARATSSIRGGQLAGRCVWESNSVCFGGLVIAREALAVAEELFSPPSSSTTLLNISKASVSFFLPRKSNTPNKSSLLPRAPFLSALFHQQAEERGESRIVTVRIKSEC